jgi:hypothetical protein
VPTLILQGGEDLRTPPAGSAAVAAAIPGHARRRPGVGHAVLAADASGCGLRALMAFSNGALRRRPACARVPTGVPAAAVPPASLEDVAARARAAGRRRAPP